MVKVYLEGELLGERDGTAEKVLVSLERGSLIEFEGKILTIINTYYEDDVAKINVKEGKNNI